MKVNYLFFVFCAILAASSSYAQGPISRCMPKNVLGGGRSTDISTPSGRGPGFERIYGESRNPRGNSQWVPNDRPNRQKLRVHHCNVCGRRMDINAGHCTSCRNRHKPHGVPE